ALYVEGCSVVTLTARNQGVSAVRAPTPQASFTPPIHFASFVFDLAGSLRNRRPHGRVANCPFACHILFMPRPEVNRSLRRLLFGMGICSLLLFLSSLPAMRFSHGIVGHHSERLHGKTNSYLSALYARETGANTEITEYGTVPPTSRPGDNVVVFYYTDSKTA